MRDEYGEMPLGNHRGAVIRIFGVILIILGALDTMLSWRGGFEVVPFHAMLIATGLLLCAVGAIRRGKRS
jgi:multisubunit Na+/H+ antiporter MnhG subunit